MPHSIDKKLTDLAKMRWAEQSMSNRTEINPYLYSEGFSYLKGKPMDINSFDILFNQLDRKSNFPIIQMKTFLWDLDINFDENDPALFQKAIEKFVTRYGMNTFAKLRTTDPIYDIYTNPTQIYVVQGNYNSLPTEYSNGIIVGYSTDTPFNFAWAQYFDTVKGEWWYTEIIKQPVGFDYSWKKLVNLNTENDFKSTQTFSGGFYDATTQLGLTSTNNIGQSVTKVIKKDADILNFPNGASFMCNIIDYNNKPDTISPDSTYAYIKRFGIDTGNTAKKVSDGIFKLITIEKTTGAKEFIGAYQDPKTNGGSSTGGRILWNEIPSIHRDNVFKLPNTFLEKTTFKKNIELNTYNLNVYSDPTLILNSYCYTDGTYFGGNIQFKFNSTSDIVKNEKAEINLITQYDPISNDSATLLRFNIDNGFSFLMNRENFIATSGSFYVNGNQIKKQNRRNFDVDLKKFRNIGIYKSSRYSSKDQTQFHLLPDNFEIENNFPEIIKEYALNDYEMRLSRPKGIDIAGLASLSIGALNTFFSSTGIGANKDVNWMPSTREDKLSLYSYADMINIPNGTTKNASFAGYPGIKPPYIEGNDCHLTNFGVGNGGSSFLVSNAPSSVFQDFKTHAYIGSLNSGSPTKLDDNVKGQEQVKWNRIAFTNQYHQWEDYQDFYKGGRLAHTGFGYNDTSVWVDIGDNRKKNGTASLAFWYKPYVQGSNDRSGISGVIWANEDKNLNLESQNWIINRSPMMTWFNGDGSSGVGGGALCYNAISKAPQPIDGHDNNGGVFQSQIGTTAGRVLFYMADTVNVMNEARIQLSPFDDRYWKLWRFRGNGNAYADNGSWISASDIRLKENFVKVDNVLDKIKSLSTYVYNRKFHKENEIGLLAQHVEKVFPDATTLNAVSYTFPNGTKIDNVLGVNYNAIAAISIAGIKELNAKVIDLEKKNDNLQQQINDLKETVKKLLEGK